MKLPLRITITTAFTVFTALSVATIAAVNFVGNRDAILEMAKSDISKSATGAEQEINRLITRAFAATGTISSLPAGIFDWRRPDALLSTLTVSLRTSPEIYGVFVGFPDGAFVQAINLVATDGTQRDVPGMPGGTATAWRVIGPTDAGGIRPEKWRYFNKKHEEITSQEHPVEKPSTYDPRTRSWFIDAQREKKAVLSDAYVFSSLRQPGVTAAQPLQHFSQATVGVDLSLRDLADLTVRLKPGDNGIVAIIDDAGNVVGYPDPSKILSIDETGTRIKLVPASAIDDDRVRNVAASTASADGEYSSFKAGGYDYIGHYSSAAASGAVNWRVVSVGAIGDFTRNLMSTLYQSLLVAGIILVVSVCGVAAMAGWITGPVVRIREMADQITKLNLSGIKTFDSPFEEIKRLQSSMNHMRAALDTFLRFVPRDVVRELIKSERAATVGGTRREVTLLFTDVENFTVLSEKMTPEQIMTQASEYFEVMSLGIQANRGTIDKFIGDAIMAFWNAPTDDPLHVDNACRGVLAAYHISKDLNDEFVSKGMAPMRTRFGLHTCDVLVGNVGARDRMQYTCLGSGVNLAARIEGLNKFYGTQVLASDTVRRGASADFLFRRVDIVEAKGTSIPMTIYELMGERGADAAFYVGDDMMKLASKYEQAFDFYLHRDFADALWLLDQLAETYPDDAVVAQLREKCREFDKNPPPPGWNGATVLDKK